MAYSQYTGKKDGNGNPHVAQAPCNVTEVDLATDADVEVTDSSAVLLGVHVIVVMSAHVALLKDSTGTVITLPASTAVGRIDTHSAAFVDDITVESDNSATGKLLVFWRAA